MAWQCISPEVTVKGFKKCCISNSLDGTVDDMLWNDSGDDEDVTMMMTPTVKTETVTLIGEGR